MWWIWVPCVDYIINTYTFRSLWAFLQMSLELLFAFCARRWREVSQTLRWKLAMCIVGFLVFCLSCCLKLGFQCKRVFRKEKPRRIPVHHKHNSLICTKTRRAYAFKVCGCEIKNFLSRVSLQSCAQSVHIRFKQIQSVSAIGAFLRPTPLSKALVLHTETQPNTMTLKLVLLCIYCTD